MIIKGIGLKIEEYKKHHSLSDAHIAGQLGIHRKTLRRIIDTNEVPKTSVFVQLLRLFKKPYEYLITDSMQITQNNNQNNNHGIVDNRVMLHEDLIKKINLLEEENRRLNRELSAAKDEIIYLLKNK